MAVDRAGRRVGSGAGLRGVHGSGADTTVLSVRDEWITVWWDGSVTGVVRSADRCAPGEGRSGAEDQGGAVRGDPSGLSGGGPVGAGAGRQVRGAPADGAGGVVLGVAGPAEEAAAA